MQQWYGQLSVTLRRPREAMHLRPAGLPPCIMTISSFSLLRYCLIQGGNLAGGAAFNRSPQVTSPASLARALCCQGIPPACSAGAVQRSRRAVPSGDGVTGHKFGSPTTGGAQDGRGEKKHLHIGKQGLKGKNRQRSLFLHRK